MARGPSTQTDAYTKFLRDFFGLPITRNLANEKLEALRRFCVRAWYWDLIRGRDVRAVIEAGYTSVDVFQILAHVAGSSAASLQRSRKEPPKIQFGAARHSPPLPRLPAPFTLCPRPGLSPLS